MKSNLPMSGLLILLLLSGCGEPTGKQDALRQTEARFGNYKVVVVESDGSEALGGDISRVDIFKGSNLLHAIYGHRFSIGNHFDCDEMKNTAPIGTDVTGDGTPNLVISEYSGGAHCCHSLHIFNIGDYFWQIDPIDLEHSYADFKNLDDDPALELPINDWTFAYWNECFAGSPAPEVILKYSKAGRRYQMAPNLMKKLPRHQAELYETAAKIRSMPQWKDPDPPWTNIPTELWGEMLNLIYSGNMAQAWKLLDLAWPEGMSGKEKFLEEFKAQLATSPFWEEIEKMNQPHT